ncbi:putative na+/proline symporter, signal transduction histidine kinase [Orientia tsutsugamushi str. UT76]|nr:putative na+/proline symporter, signal transduction histidine kinase [Orientia tsutsugamushi str. UT76]
MLSAEEILVQQHLLQLLLATWIGGGTFSLGLYEIYALGILAVLPIIGQILGLLCYPYILIPRMQEFLGKLSVADVMGDLYGTHVRIIIAICSIIRSQQELLCKLKFFLQYLIIF